MPRKVTIIKNYLNQFESEILDVIWNDSLKYFDVVFDEIVLDLKKTFLDKISFFKFDNFIATKSIQVSARTLNNRIKHKKQIESIKKRSYQELEIYFIFKALQTIDILLAKRFLNLVLKTVLGCLEKINRENLRCSTKSFCAINIGQIQSGISPLPIVSNKK